MHNFGMDILALSETHWAGPGKRNLDKRYTILHNGGKIKEVAGVAIMLSKTTSTALTNRTPVDERTFTARFADVDTKSAWSIIKKVYNRTVAASFGHAKRPKDQWLSETTWNLIGECCNLKLLLLRGDVNNETVLKNQMSIDLDTQVKRRTRIDKTSHLDKKTAMADEATKLGDYRVA
ncbi:hypothetical protein QYM36_006719 [Artemia franciscana]|uniref:Endonuclease-reverse transcriptase n=1 Tax=Artemia franciscana TaxID=6661 RepID=A0AA88HY66_ARTSF|nr:hypothetical protein QYM36_006719 [Artemia franciscana]